ncbi:MAG: glycosyltransferase family 2 protein [Alphaproteobacteria bacterium]|nr:glycosyltransferase family 2 protein [Alphaproteobacteria bacterium]
MDKVSIIMPLYNAERFVPQAIQSVQNQTYKKWELLIVDDASTDRSLSIAKKFAESDDRIKVFHHPQNLGISATRNSALEQASGRYIAFLDADDTWARQKLKCQIFFMNKRRAALSHTSYAFMNSQGSVLPVGRVNVDKRLDLPQYMKTTQIGTSTVMIDRQKISHISFPKDNELGEDDRVWMGFMHQGHTFCGLNKILTLYRVYPEQRSFNKFEMAANTLKRYWSEKNLPTYKRLYYFVNYAYHGIEKRLRPMRLNVPLVTERFGKKTKE